MQTDHSQRLTAALPDDFAEGGLFVRRAGPVPKRFQVLGERSSGTNFLHRLLQRNSALEPTETLGWKHGHPSALAIAPDVAVICVVRNAADWACSMHFKPWHAVPALQELDFPAFLRARWDTVIDRPRYFGGKASLIGQPLQADRDPATGHAPETLFALRRQKLRGLLSYLNRDCTCALVRMEALQAAPEAMVDRLMTELGLPPRTRPFRSVTKRLGAKFKPAVAVRPVTPSALSPADHAFMMQQLDHAIEASLGYNYVVPAPPAF